MGLSSMLQFGKNCGVEVTAPALLVVHLTTVPGSRAGPGRGEELPFCLRLLFPHRRLDTKGHEGAHGGRTQGRRRLQRAEGSEGGEAAGSHLFAGGGLHLEESSGRRWPSGADAGKKGEEEEECRGATSSVRASGASRRRQRGILGR